MSYYLAVVRLCGILALVTTLCLWNASPATAQSETSPKTCRIGAYVLELRDFDLVKESFGSSFWVWAICPSEDLKPLTTLEFINSKKIDTAYDTVLERKDIFGNFRTQDKVFWSFKKVSGEFHKHWDVRNFPFDRHTLEIPMEDSVLDSSAFVYLPDPKNSSYNKTFKVHGWTITGFNIREEKSSYETTYGDPELKDGQSSFSRAVVSIDIKRNSIIGFFKLTAVVYIGFILSIATYFLNPAHTSLMSGKLSAPVGSLFAVVVNQRAAESILGRTEGLTLVDQVHITAMAYILMAVVIAVWSRLISERGDEKRAIRLNHLSAYIAGISFLAINIVLIVHAAING